METETMKQAAAFCAALEAATAAHFAKHYPRQKAPCFLLDAPGRRFVRVVRTGGLGRSREVVVFVEIATGTIWKADSWKKPSMNFPRGNVADPAAWLAANGGHA